MIDIYPKKAKFKRNEEIGFFVEGFTEEAIKVIIYKNNNIIYEDKQVVQDGELNLFATDDYAGGYLAEFIFSDGTVMKTAFDVDSDMIRYGFLSDFFAGDEENTDAVTWLNKLHINYIQYYDWMYRHDDLIPPEVEFEDLLKRRLSLKTVQSRIRQGASFGMENIAYGAIYGASNEFADQHSKWCMYGADGKKIGFFDFLSIMNVNRASGWHDHIINEYKKAIELGFDGIHMDTYGFPKAARDSSGKPLDLPSDFGVLIDDTKEILTQVNPQVRLIFNNVGNWPVESVANRRQEAIYIEVWDPYSTYQALEEIVKNARNCNPKKQIILAAYLKVFRNEVTIETFHALSLLTSVITVLGASHLIHGENGGIITEGYYANYYRCTDEQYTQFIRSSYDYITYYADFWTDSSYIDVSRTHFKGDNREYVEESGVLSPNLEAGKVWTNIRQNERCKFINFVNLTEVEDTIWNKEKKVKKVDGIQLKILLENPIQDVSFTSLEGATIRIEQLKYTMQETEFGQYMVIDLPTIYLWTTVIVRMLGEEEA